MDEPLTAAVAEDLLDGETLIPAMAGSIPEMKALRDRCLEAGFPALVGCPPGAGKGWGTKTHLLVQEEHLGKLGDLVRGDWRDHLEREGLPAITVKAAANATVEDLPCPACGTVAPLVDGACSDCGLQLE